MNRGSVCICAVISLVLFAGSAVASDQADVMAPVHQFIDGFNNGDAKSALAACAEQTTIIDEFAPYTWQSCSAWANDYEADAKKNKVTDGKVTLGEPMHVDVTGDRAYVVVPARYTFKQNGTMMNETDSILTVALHKTADGWRITSWTWAKH